MYDTFFPEDVADRLLALAGANERALTLARRYGMDAEAADLCQEVYAGALADVGAAFGLAPTMLLIPHREEVIAHDHEIDGAGPELSRIPERATFYR